MAMCVRCSAENSAVNVIKCLEAMDNEGLVCNYYCTSCSISNFIAS